MTTALYVTTKQFCKRAWLGALLAVGTLVLGPLAFLMLVRLQGLSLDYMEHDLSGYHFAFLGVSWVFFLAVCLYAQAGCEKVCLALPVSSRAIASWMMFAMAGLVVLLELVTNGMYRLLFFDERWLGDYWPLLGPLFFVFTLILVAHALFWSMHAPSLTRLLAGAALIVGMFAWFISRYYPYGFKGALVPWSQVSLGEFITMQLVCVVAWYQGTRAFSQVRAGTAVPSPMWEQLTLWWNGILTGTIPEQQTQPVSQRSSLAKLHWRDSCHKAVVFCGLLMGLGAFVVNLLFSMQINPELSNLRHVVEGFLVFTTVFGVISAVIIGALLGDGICNTEKTELKRFLAVAPLTDRDFSVTLLGNMVKTLLWSILIIEGTLLLSVVVTAALYGAGVFQTLMLPDLLVNGFLNHTLLCLLAFWIVAANIVSVLWTGRNWVISTTIGLGFGGFIFYVITINLLQTYFHNSAISKSIQVGMFLFLYVCIQGGTLLAYTAALRQQLLSKRQTLLAALVWCIAIGGILIWLLNMPRQYHGEVRWSLFCITSAVTSLALLPFATLLLALRWNRHR